MVAAYGGNVAVTGKYNDRSVWHHHFNAGRPCEGAAVNAVEHIGLEIYGNSCRTADTGDVHHVLRIHIKIVEHLSVVVEYLTAAAAAAEEMRELFGS